MRTVNDLKAYERKTEIYMCVCVCVCVCVRVRHVKEIVGTDLDRGVRVYTEVP